MSISDRKIKELQNMTYVVIRHHPGIIHHKKVLPQYYYSTNTLLKQCYNFRQNYNL